MSTPPAGTGPASAYGVITPPSTAGVPAILADEIDAVTGDYSSLLRSRPLADAFAIEALSVERGTGAAVRELGHRLRTLRNVEAGTVDLAESLAREALAPAEDAGVLEVVRVLAETDGSDPTELNFYLEYRDLLAPGQPVRRLVFGG
jgi:hypothetical protein